MNNVLSEGATQLPIIKQLIIINTVVEDSKLG